MYQRPVSYLKALCFCCLAFAARTAAESGDTPALYLHNQIDYALELRDQYFSTLGIGPESMHDGLQTLPQLNEIRSRLAERPDSDNPWYSFLMGLTDAVTSRVDAAFYFSTALKKAGDDPGTTWLLFVEFDRYSQELWANNSLRQLERQLLARGARAAPVIAQQLMHYARTASEEKIKDDDYFREWIGVFDPHTVWPSLQKIREGFPLRPHEVLAGVEDLTGRFTRSWQLQLTVAHTAVRWIARVVLLFMIGGIAGLAVRYLPVALHPLSEILPPWVPPRFRTAVTLCICIVALALGLYPSLWLLVFLLVRRVRGRERGLVAVCIGLLALWPFATRIEDMVRSCRAPDNAPALFTKALREGHYGALEKELVQRARRDPDDYLTQCACALTYLKKSDLHRALKHVRRADSLSPDDPVVLTASGAIYYHGGLAPSARPRFERAGELFPDYAPTVYNLGQYYLKTMETLDGMEYITHATKLDPRWVNRFIHKNETYFTEHWPRQREFMLADYPPGYFWRRVFPRYNGSWETASRLWGATMLGLGLLPSAVIAIALALAAVVFAMRAWRGPTRGIKRVLSCSACGAPVCRKCMRGTFCASCSATLDPVRDKGRRTALSDQRRESRDKVFLLLATVMHAVFPGTKSLVTGVGVKGRTWGLLAATSAVYASLLGLATARFAYPFWVARGWVAPIAALCLLYPLVSIGRGVIQTYRIVQSSEGRT